MERSVEAGRGFTVLDGAAMIVGAAVASLHFSGAAPPRLTGLGWGLVWGAFAGIALTAAGPALFLARRFLRRLQGYPRVGDRLWATLGTPWLLAALVRDPRSSERTGGEIYVAVLTIGLAVSILLAIVSVWKIWVLAVRDRGEEDVASPWTNRVGLALAVAWPLQCGYALLLLGGGGS